MKIIALFAPAIITMAIRFKKNGGEAWGWFDYVKEYLQALLFNVIVTESIITYVLGASGEESIAFERFSFFTKYMWIACAIAYITPCFWSALNKAFAISCEVCKRDEK